jgi:hypothetical protein
MHFGLAGALRVDLAVHWPNGSVETFEDVAADRLYEITEGQGLQAVTPGGGNPYSCGRPVFQASQDAGAFVWRDCRNDLWKVRFASGGPGTVYTGRVLSQLPFVDVSPFSIEATDVFDTESDPRQAVFEFEVAGTGQDGFDVILAAEASGCLIVDSPTAAPVIYGPFNALVTQPVDLLTGGSCALSLNALSVTGAAANESAGSIDFVVSLSAASVTPVEVSVATADGTATAGSDYSALALQVLTFQPGETEKVVTVGILDDAIAEGDETFFLTLTNPSGATITAASATATINDDEVGLSIADVAGAESAGTLTFTVSLSTARTVPVTVEFSTADVEATAGQDYVAVAPTVLTLDPGELMASVSVTLVDDHLIEGNETFLALLANASGAQIVDGSAIGTIVDDESPAVLTVADIAAVESDGVLTFTAMLSAPLAAAASVDFATQDGSAVAGTDYLAASGTLVFAPGNVSRSVQLTLLDDQLPEPGEAFFLRLTNPANLVLARTQATATVADDDGALICGEPDWDPAGEALVAIWQNCIEGTWHLRATAGSGFRSYAGTVFSNQGFESVTGVSIEGGDTLDVSSDPTAIVFGLGMTAPGFDGIDFAASADASLCVDVNVQPGSSVIAGAGRVPVTLSRFDPRTLQSCPALPTLTVSDVDVSEADGTAVFTLQMSAASTEPVTVDVRTLNGSAIAGSDYVALPAQTVVFAPGEVSRQLPVTVLGACFFKVHPVLDTVDWEVDIAAHRRIKACHGVPPLGWCGAYA